VFPNLLRARLNAAAADVSRELEYDAALRTARRQLAEAESQLAHFRQLLHPSGNEPRISVITPSFQKGRYIRETIESVLQQNDGNFEHIVVDAGSTDETLGVLRQYPHIRWVSEPDRGQAHAINKGLLMSTGQIVSYLNADDVYRPNAFAQVRQFFESTPEARIVVGNCDYIDDQSNIQGHLKAKYEKFEDLIRYWGWDRWYCIPQQSTFWRRDLLTEVGLFDISLHMVMDYDMWLRAAELTPIHVLDQTLAGFRITPDTKTGSSTHLMYYEEYRTSKKYWGRLPPGRRIRVAVEARHHLAMKLLDIAEHSSLNDMRRQVMTSLIKSSISYWPVATVYPRLLCTAAETLAGESPVREAIKRVHRKYLGLRWRLQQSS
jgi:glycosyltransferase involved in cell wall biosynthesis